MQLHLSTYDPRCPRGLPVAVIDTDTDTIWGTFKSKGEAERALTVWLAGGVYRRNCQYLWIGGFQRSRIKAPFVIQAVR